MYFITRDRLTDLIRNYYSGCYGIISIENTEIDEFLNNIESNYNSAQQLISSVGILKDVISGTHTYTDDFLKMNISFPSILTQAANIGLESNNKDFIILLLTILQRKKVFTQDNGAWSQYVNLADWLIDFACILKIKNSFFEKDFCDIALHSFRYSSKRQYYGYSWDAWHTWHNRWQDMKIENQILLQELIENNTWLNVKELEEFYN